MANLTLPDFSEDIADMTSQEKKEIMRIEETSPQEKMLRDIFLESIITYASDIHISGIGERGNPEIKISIEDSNRKSEEIGNHTFRNLHLPASPDNVRFREKLFGLCGISLGGTEPIRARSRFSMALPIRFAKKYGLQPKKGYNRYYLDYRVQYVNTFDGFAFTIRLLDPQKIPDLENFGLTHSVLTTLIGQLQTPGGIGFISGPTGSGKTSLAFSIIEYLNDGNISIFTAEDPPEYTIRGAGPIKQLAIGGEITWAAAAQEAVRHHPRLIYIGEINDPVTMSYALELANTGHFVMATIHADDEVLTLDRALKLCPDPQRDSYRLAEAMKFIIAQRLVRSYGGERKPYQLRRIDREWIANNGIVVPPEGIKLPSTDNPGMKYAIASYIVSNNKIRTILRKNTHDTDAFYKAAREQPQYETLPEAGFRILQEHGASFEDMRKLPTKPICSEEPGYRSKLVGDHPGKDYVGVNDMIDKFVLDEEHETTLDEYVKAQELKCA